MAQVSSQLELQQAIALSDPLIEITADFTIGDQINITYPVTLQSLTASGRNTLTRLTGYSGTLFFVGAGGNLTVKDLILDGDKTNTPNAQPIIHTAAVLTLNNTTLQNNASISNGGGIATATAAAICTLINNSIIQNCESLNVGGGIFLIDASSLNMSQSALLNNTATVGGGLFINTGAVAEIEQGLIAENTASVGNGGGIFVNTSGELHCQETTIAANMSNGVGGGVFLNSFATITVFEGTVNGNSGTDGAGLFANNDTQITCTNAEISRNIASGNGGGMFLNPNASAMLTNTPVTSNQAVDGAGIYANFNSILIYENGEFSGNIASRNGGGILVGSNDATITDTIFQDNRASNGAGIFLNDNSQFSASGLQINNNTASINGGGLYINQQSLTLDDIPFINNSAAFGGGIFVNVNSSLIYTNGTVSNNSATEDGGGIFVNTGSSVSLSNTPVMQNSAGLSGGGIFVNAEGVLSFLSSSIIQNTAGTQGGGIFVNERAQADLTDTVLSDNYAQNGGGVFAQASEITVANGSRINGNTALENGGGVYVVYDATANITGTDIYGNNAVNGAGVYSVSRSILNYSNGDISRNVSSGDGGAIYLTDGGEAHVMVPASIYANTAGGVAPGIYNGGILGLGGAVRIPNGVYLVSSENLIQVEASLNGALVQLDQSPYVFPDASRAPIDVAEGTTGYPILTQADQNTFLKPEPNFVHWFVERNEDDTRIRLNIRDIYTITYLNLMGATHNNPTEYSENTLPIVLQEPTPIPGYRFIGWFDAPTGGNLVTVIPNGTTGNLILYARWVPVTPPVPPCPPCIPACCCCCCCSICTDRRCGFIR